MTDRKIGEIRSHFAVALGARINRYETAELQRVDGTWDDWPDLPIRLYTDAGTIIAISWSRSDDLWIAGDLSLPFSVEGSTIRWVKNRIDRINAAVGGSIRLVMLGQEEMSNEGRDDEIWTRVLIQLDSGWLEIFNAGDENGYNFHAERPAGNFIACT
jgi:hypothetical protein